MASDDSSGESLPLAEERLSVGRRRVTTARVRLHLRAETEQRQVEAELRTDSVEVERVPLDRELRPGEAPPAPREEEGGAVLVVPVLEEVLVVEKRLVLREELRIRRRSTVERVQQPVTLRRQHAELERLPPEPRGQNDARKDVPRKEPSMNQRTITAVFDSMQAVERASHDLAMRLGGVRATIYNANSGSVSELGLPEEDCGTLEEAMRRGGAVVSACVPAEQFDQAADALEGAGAVDLDQRESEWRREGWKATAAGSDMAAKPTTSASGMGAATSRPAPVAGTTGARTGDNEAIPIVEEKLRIGKREVSHGRVRVRSYVVETPVQEQVTLHQEHVQVERTSMDRPAAPDDKLFQERTMEATERTEEPVVSKEARVTGEVRLRKTAEEEQRTVSDKVRRTEVEVDDGRKTAGETSRGPGTTPNRSGPDRGA